MAVLSSTQLLALARLGIKITTGNPHSYIDVNTKGVAALMRFCWQQDLSPKTVIDADMLKNIANTYSKLENDNRHVCIGWHRFRFGDDPGTLYGRPFAVYEHTPPRYILDFHPNGADYPRKSYSADWSKVHGAFTIPTSYHLRIEFSSDEVEVLKAGEVLRVIPPGY